MHSGELNIEENYGCVSFIRQKRILKMKIAEILCMVTKAARNSNCNPVMQISQRLQNTASWTQLSIKKDRIVDYRLF